jgi:hypothetical protein
MAEMEEVADSDGKSSSNSDSGSDSALRELTLLELFMLQ